MTVRQLLLLAAFIPSTYCQGNVLAHKLAERQCSSMAERPSIDITELPSDRTLTAGSRLELSCAAVAMPQATIEWLFDGQPIDKRAQSNNMEVVANLGQRTVQLATTKSKISIPCVDKSFAGQYTCVAKNACVSKKATAKIAVEGEAKSCSLTKKRQEIMGVAPQIWMWTVDRLERVDASVQLFCRAKGVPKPKVTWYEESLDGKYKLVENSQHRTLLPNGDLLLKEQGSTRGALGFRCEAKNVFGSQREDMLLIQVDMDDK